MTSRIEEMDEKSAKIETFSHAKVEKNSQLADKISELKQKSAELAEKDILLEQTTARLEELREKYAKAQQQLEERTEWAQSLDRQLHELWNTNSWKITRPLRAIAYLKRKFWLAIMLVHKEGLFALLGRLKRKYLSVRYQPQQIATTNFMKQWSALVFNKPKTPLISIIIPVYNKHLYTFNCLQSILENGSEIDYEVVVVDDCSQDDTQKMLSAMSGARVHRNIKNSGFIVSCNKGAEIAKGKYLVFLNNDTTVTEGWLKALLNTFTIFHDTGLVGAKLVYPDGRLQEAGGIVWQDGSAWNYGRFDDPNKPEYNYVREVDYCSGACLMIRRELFNQLGKFDSLYFPAYYEDTDLAFKVRQAGKKVIYQHKAVIIHYEGVSSGTDTSSGIKQYQEINHDNFFKRWEKILKKHRINGLEPYFEKERRVKKRVLVIDARMLLPDHDSGSLRMFNILKVLQTLSYKVTFITDNIEYLPPYTQKLQEIGIEAIYGPYISSVNEHLEQAGKFYDVVILSRADVAEKYINIAHRYCSKAKIIFDTVDLHFLREQRTAAVEGHAYLANNAKQRKQQELGIMKQANVTTWVVSPVEKEILEPEIPDIRVVSNIHVIHGCKSTFEERKDILFIGGFEHPPNTDAVIYFVQEIFPLLKQRISGIKFYIVGTKPPKLVQKMAANDVIVTGYVEDIAPLFNNIRLTVAPLRYGAGVKGKINTSMSYGIPVVATPIASEGMYLENGKNVLVAENAEDFAEAIIRLYQEKTLWKRLSENGFENIREHFSFEVAKRDVQRGLM